MKDRAMRCAEGIQKIQDEGGFDSIEQMAEFIRTFYREDKIPDNSQSLRFNWNPETMTHEMAESPSLKFLDTGRDEE